MIDEHSITDAVIASVDGRNARVRDVSKALVRHLHAFVREVEPTFEEWETAIQFLTRTGQICDEKRQEFILLSDVLGVSMLVDAINHRGSGATESTVLGPFYVPTAAEAPSGADIAGDMRGERLHVRARVRSTAGTPLARAIVDVWHSDADGYYDVQRTESDTDEGRARFRADASGAIDFWTVLPAPYPIPDDGPVGELLTQQGRHPYRPAHVHFRIEAEGHQTLVTHIFVAGSEYLDSDVVFGVKLALIAAFERVPDGHHTLVYDFQLEPAADV